MSEGWETRQRRIAYSCEGFDVVNERVGLPDGSETEFDYLSEGASVVVFPLTRDGSVVVIDEWRHAVGRHNRSVPAGGIEPAESVEEATRRELAEETGYEAGEVTPMTTVEPANGFADTVFHYCLARGCVPTGERDLDDDETIAVETTTVEALLEAVRDGTVRDGRLAFATAYYALFERGGAGETG